MLRAWAGANGAGPPIDGPREPAIIAVWRCFPAV